MLDMNTDTMIVNGERIPLSTSFKDSKPVVARVSVTKRVVGSTSSVVRIRCKMSAGLGNYYKKPVDELKLPMPRDVCAADKDPKRGVS